MVIRISGGNGCKTKDNSNYFPPKSRNQPLPPGFYDSNIFVLPYQSFIYVIKLENNKYYIGETNNILHRIKKHKSFYKYIKLIDLVIYEPSDKITYNIRIKNNLNGNAVLVENRITLEYMNIYGYNNVRGGSYTHKKDYIKEPKKLK